MDSTGQAVSINVGRGGHGVDLVGLRRCLGVPGVLFLTLSVATPASSVFVIIPGMFAIAGTGAVWALALAGLVCIATAFIYAELSSAWPVAGGEYVMVGMTLGPQAGFVMLVLNVINNLLFPPVAALGVSTVAAAFWPGLPVVPTAMAVMALATLASVFDIRVGATVTGLFLAVEVFALGAIVALGLAAHARPWSGFLLHPVMPAGGALVPASAAAIGVATSIAIFALNGYGAAVYFAEEMHDASRLIARAIVAALAATLLLEGLPILAGLGGARDLFAFVTADDPFGALAATGGKVVAAWIAFGVVVAIVNAIIAGILAGARFLYATARDAAWGGVVDATLGAVDRASATPVASTLVAGVGGMLACLLPLRLLLVLSGAGLVAVYAGVALAAVAGRRSGASLHAPYRMPLYPLAPVVTGAALAYVAWTSWLDPGEGRTGLIVTGGEILGAAFYYRLVLRRRGWQVRVPAAG